MKASLFARTAGASLLLVWTLFGGAGCAGPCSPEPVRCTILLPAEAAAPESVTEGRIYLDLSQSMGGYISVPMTPFQRSLDGLIQEAFAEVRLANPALVGFGSSLRKDLPGLESFVLGESPRRKFNEKGTDLGLAFRDIGKSPKALSVVVTDGAQDQRAGSGQGFIRTALVNSVRDELIKKGFGVWLVGLMSSFDDCYYNVRPNHQGRIGQCIRVQRRPVYFWVFSRDLDKGRALVRSLFSRLRAEAPKDLVKALELSPGVIPEVHLAQPEAEKVGRLVTSKTVSRDRLAILRLWRSPAAACVELPFVTDGTAQLPLALRLSSPEADLAPPGINWKVSVESPEGLQARTLPGILLLEIPPSQSGNVEVPVILQADLQRGLETSWIGRWSTRDDTSAQALEGRTLYLFDVLSELLAPLAEPQRAACLHLTLIGG